MTTAQPRPVLELVPTETPVAGWSDLGEPLAEAAVLGCLMRTSRQHAAALLDAFTEQDLTVPQHRHVAAAARALLEQGHPIDPVTVLGQLRRHGTENARTDNRDAGVLLVELCQAAPCVSSAGHYLRIVLEHAYRRRAQQAATRLLQAAETGSLTALHGPGRARARRAHHGAPPHHSTPAVAGRRAVLARSHAPPPSPLTPGALPCPPPDPTWPAPPPWLTACPLLTAHLTALHPDLRTALLSRLAGIGTLRDRDGLLLLTHDDQAAATTGTGKVPTTIYLGTDSGGAGVWARAVKLRAREVLVLPDQDAQLVALLTQHLGATA